MNRREFAIAAAMVVSIAGSVGFMFAYARNAGTQLEGLTLGIALVGLTFTALGWAFWILDREQTEDARDSFPSDAGDRAAAVAELEAGEAEVSRRGVLVNLLIAALGAFGLATLFPIRSLGPAPGKTLFKTRWASGMLLVRDDGQPIHSADLDVDSAVTVFPQGAVGDSASQAMLVRLPEGVGNSVRGYVAYSKLCTHAGCPVALYRAPTHQLLCPCHQSLFDAVDGGRVVAGPADHALPQLPIDIDERGFLRATGDFPSPVGPGFWERG
ncbi:MAG TPA: Rieske 2Fe-2S domain-containing protein [Candidatus Tumulicola sp.]|jgi:ubiquinol-cytochrome c reductase iron-sulfur subunit